MQANWIVEKNKPARSEGEHVLGANRAGTKEYSAVDCSSTDFFAIFKHKWIG